MNQPARRPHRARPPLARVVLPIAVFFASDALAQPLQWTPRAPMPVPVSRAACGVVDRTLVVLGGTTSGVGPAGQATDAVQAYDADIDAWRLLGPLPEPRFAAARAALGGTIYVAGGASTFPPTPLSSILAYEVDGGGSVQLLGNLATARFRAGAAVLDGKLYVVGGEGRDSTGAPVVLSSVEEIDLATHTVIESYPLPEPRQLAAVASMNGYVHVMGGLDASGNPTSTCWRFRPAFPTLGWTACAPLPYPRSGSGAEAGHNRIVLPENATSSGLPPTAWSGEVLEYNPYSDVWTSRGSLATQRHGAPSGVIQDHLYVVGGDDSSGTLSVNEAAALDVPAWPVMPSALRARMPTLRGGGTTVVLDGRVYAVAGTERTGPPGPTFLSAVEVFDPAANTWTALPPLSEGRFSARGAAVGTVVYLPGGRSPSSSALPDVLAYDLPTGASWIDGQLVQPRYRHGAAALGTRIYVVGGVSAGMPGSVLDSVEAYDVAAHASTLVAPIPEPREAAAVAAANGVLYVIGGYDASGVASAAVWAYDTATDTWSARAPMPVAASGPAQLVGGRIVVLGGSSGGNEHTDAIQIYDPVADAWTIGGALDSYRRLTMAAAVGGEVFLIGGLDGSLPLGLVESYAFGGGAPPTSVIVWPAGGAALNLRDVVVSGTAAGDASVTRVELSTDGGVAWVVAAGTTEWTFLWQPLAEGYYVLESRAVDTAGTVQSPPSSSGVTIDWTPPSVSSSVSPPGNGTGWWNVPVTVAFTCSDALSGVASCPSPVTLSTEGGGQIAIGTASDRAGNSATAQSAVSIDFTAPAIAAAPSPAANAAGWWNGPVTVSFACSDALSGVASCSGPLTLSTEGANQTAAGAAADRAGNSAATSLSVNIDLTAPSIAAEPLTSPSASGWWNAPVTVTFACSDLLSGIASCPDPVTVAFEGAGWEVTGSAADKADNGSIATATVNVDMTPPTCAAYASGLLGSDGVYRSSVVVSIDAADALSGVSAIEVDTGRGWVVYSGPLVIDDPGLSIVSCRAFDAAGNAGFGSPLLITRASDQTLQWLPHAPMPVTTSRAVSAVVDRTLYVLGGIQTRSVLAYDAGSDAWRTLAPLPEARASSAAATLGGTIYLAGGMGGATAASTVLAYDVDGGGSSRVLATLQTPRYRAGDAINAGKLYVVGGSSPAGVVLDTVEEVDLATGVSVTKTTLPAPRTMSGVAVTDGSLYVMGGLDASMQPTDTCWKLRLVEPLGSWTPCAMLPYPRGGTALWAHGRILLPENVVSSGMPPTAWTGDVLAYDPRADSWSVSGQHVPAVRGAAVGVIQDALFIAGGNDGTALVTNESAALHVPEWPVLPWQLRPRMPTPRRVSVSAVVDGRMIAAGGTTWSRTPTGPVATVEAFDPAAGAWSALPPLAQSRSQSPGGAVDGVIYLTGGSTNGQSYLSDVLAYDVRTGASWIDGQLLEPRMRHGAAVIGNRIYVAGGRTTGGVLSTSVEAYDVTTHASTPLAPLPAGRDMARTVAVGQRLFVVGGMEGTSALPLLEYDFAQGSWISRTPPPYPTGSALALGIGNRIVVPGTKTQTGPSPTELGDEVQVYDAVTDTWTVIGALDTFRTSAVPVALGGELYLVGGTDGSAPLGLVESIAFDAVAPGSAIDWPADGTATNARELLVSGRAWDDAGLAGVDVSTDGGASWSRATGAGEWTYGWVPLAEGEHLLASRATDVSANVQDPPALAHVVVDWTAPAIAASAAPAANAAGWWNAPVTVSFACSDALSGVASCPAPVEVAAETPGQEIAGTARDRADNMASTFLAVRIDLTPPSCSATVSGTPGGNGSYVSDVVVTVAASDALSGVSAVEVSTGGAWVSYATPFTVTAEGTTTVTCRATDAAGNGAIGTPVAFTIDRVAPTVSSTSPEAGAQDVPTNVVIVVTFSEPVVAAAAYQQIALLRDGKRSVPFTSSISGSVLTIAPADTLFSARSYSVSIPAGAVADGAGNAFASSYAFDFQTAK